MRLIHSSCSEKTTTSMQYSTIVSPDQHADSIAIRSECADTQDDPLQSGPHIYFVDRNVYMLYPRSVFGNL